MTNLEKVKKTLEKAPGQTSLAQLVRQSANELGKALPSHLNPERMVRIALTALRLNPKLAECTPESFLGSLFVLAQIGLEPIAGRAYLVPYKNTKKIIVNGREEWRSVSEVQAILGYKGLIELFYRHESALTIEMQTVRRNDQFDYQYGTDSYLRHKPAIDRGEAIGYYAIAKMKGGGSIFRFMTREECIEHGMRHSKTYDRKAGVFFSDSPWAKDTDAMCMKTVLIQLAKVLPLSVELQRAIAVDETSREYRKGIDDMMDLPDVTVWNEPPNGPQNKPQNKPQNEPQNELPPVHITEEPLIMIEKETPKITIETETPMIEKKKKESEKSEQSTKIEQPITKENKIDQPITKENKIDQPITKETKPIDRMVSLALESGIKPEDVINQLNGNKKSE